MIILLKTLVKNTRLLKKIKHGCDDEKNFLLQLIFWTFKLNKQLSYKKYCSQQHQQWIVMRAAQRVFWSSCFATHSRPMNSPGNGAITVTKITILSSLLQFTKYGTFMSIKYVLMIQTLFSIFIFFFSTQSNIYKE